MKKSEQNIEVILNSVLIIEAKLDTLIKHTVSDEEMDGFNEKLHLHIADTKRKLSLYFDQLNQVSEIYRDDRFLV